MPVQIEALNLQRDEKPDRFTLTRHPDECPICRQGVQPTFWVAAALPPGREIQAVYRCPRHPCLSVFIAYYRRQSRTSGNFSLERSAPLNFQHIKFGEAIEETSPDFIEIFNQAAKAESDGLDEVAGVGYRKALEFLIKDYLIKKYPDEEESLRKKFLGACINDHLEDEALRNCAKLASWLGNDETHYERRWVDKDIEDLKNLIGLTVHSIAAAEMRGRYEEEMLEGDGGESED